MNSYQNTKVWGGIFLCISLILGIIIFTTYQPKISYWLIVNLLESKSLILNQHLLNYQTPSLVSFATGKPFFVFPSLLLSPLIIIWDQFGINPTFIVPLINIFLISSGLILVSHHYQKQNIPSYLKLIIFLTFILSPWVWRTSIESVSSSLIIFCLSIFLTTNNIIVRTLSLTIALISSAASFIIFPLLIITNQIYSKNKPQESIIHLLISFIVIILIFKTSPTIFTNTYFPNIKPETYGYQIDIHRQADLVGGSPVLGKIYYNKYVFVARQISNRIFSYLDWDRFLFIKSSGKSDNPHFDFPQFTWIELPLIVAGIIYSLKQKPKLIFFILATAISAAVVSLETDPGIFLWFSLIIIEMYAINQLFNQKYQLLTCLFFVTCLICKTSLVNLSFNETNYSRDRYDAYLEMSKLLKQKQSEKFIITDEIGQPHIYLTYFDVFPLTLLQQSLSQAKSLDKDYFRQPNSMNNVNFLSINQINVYQLYKDYPDYSFIGFDSSLAQFAIDNPKIINSDIVLNTKIITDQGTSQETKKFLRYLQVKPNDQIRK
jgi:hypothetical protein